MNNRQVAAKKHIFPGKWKLNSTANPFEPMSAKKKSLWRCIFVHKIIKSNVHWDGWINKWIKYTFLCDTPATFKR